jgi:hypothetical protein
MNNSKPENRSPLKFFLLVYGLSIPLWIIEIIIDVKRLPLNFSITDILAAFTPLIAATILVYKEEGLIGTNQLFKRIFDFSRITQKIWYLPIILLPFLMYLLIYIIIHFIGLPLQSNLIFLFFLSLFFLLVFSRICGEETGYMGLCHRSYARTVWGIISKYSCEYTLGSMALPVNNSTRTQSTLDSLDNSWYSCCESSDCLDYNNTGKSLFACILFHTLLNVGRPLFPGWNT